MCLSGSGGYIDRKVKSVMTGARKSEQGRDNWMVLAHVVDAAGVFARFMSTAEFGVAAMCSRPSLSGHARF